MNNIDTKVDNTTETPEVISPDTAETVDSTTNVPKVIQVFREKVRAEFIKKKQESEKLDGDSVTDIETTKKDPEVVEKEQKVTTIKEIIHAHIKKNNTKTDTN